jgi:hypothetical protein
METLEKASTRESDNSRFFILILSKRAMDTFYNLEGAVIVPFLCILKQKIIGAHAPFPLSNA